MPSRYRRDADRLKAEIVGRVAAGETVRAACAADGMPSVQAVRNWARADAAFDAALAEAFRQSKARKLAFDSARAQAFLAAARAGASVHTLFGKPGMPRRGEYYRWRRENADFAAATAWLVERRDTGIGDRGRARRLDFDPAVADEIVARLRTGLAENLRLEDLLEGDSALPCWQTMMRWRGEQPVFDRALRSVFWKRRTAVTAFPRTKAVCDHIRAGGTFLSYSRLSDGVSLGRLRRWMRDPAFRQAVSRACMIRDLPMLEEILETAGAIPPMSARETKRAVGPLMRQMAGRWIAPHKPLWPSRRRKRAGLLLSRTRSVAGEAG